MIILNYTHQICWFIHVFCLRCKENSFVRINYQSVFKVVTWLQLVNFRSNLKLFSRRRGLACAAGLFALCELTRRRACHLTREHPFRLDTCLGQVPVCPVHWPAVRPVIRVSLAGSLYLESWPREIGLQFGIYSVKYDAHVTSIYIWNEMMHGSYLFHSWELYQIALVTLWLILCHNWYFKTRKGRTKKWTVRSSSTMCAMTIL